jgi:hypothetical protein
VAEAAECRTVFWKNLVDKRSPKRHRTSQDNFKGCGEGDACEVSLPSRLNPSTPRDQCEGEVMQVFVHCYRCVKPDLPRMVKGIEVPLPRSPLTIQQTLRVTSSRNFPQGNTCK